MALSASHCWHSRGDQNPPKHARGLLRMAVVPSESCCPLRSSIEDTLGTKRRERSWKRGVLACRGQPWECLPCNQITGGALVKWLFYCNNWSVSFLLAPCKHLRCHRSHEGEVGAIQWGMNGSFHAAVPQNTWADLSLLTLI